MRDKNGIYLKYRKFTVDFPPEIYEDDVLNQSRRLNLILKTPAIVNFTEMEEFYLHYANHVREIVHSIRDVFFFQFDENREKFIPRMYGELDIDYLDEPLDKIIDIDVVGYIKKPLLFVKEVDDDIDQVLQILNTEQMVIFPLYVDGVLRGIFGCTCEEGSVLKRSEVKVLWNLVFYLELFYRMQESSKTLVYYAFYDPLTALLNRRVFHERLEQEVLKTRRTGKHFTLLIADIDNFKEYNDRFHHAAGDMTLQEVSEILRESVREIDTVARLGGDEFGIILSGTGSSDSLLVAERILSRVSSHLFPDGTFERTQRLTLSIGASAFPQDAFTSSELVNKADKSLFLAKKLGGNRTIRSEDAFLMKMGTGPVLHEIQPQNLYEAVRTVFNFDKFMEIVLHISLDALNAERGSLFVKGWGDPDYILLAKRGFSTNGNGKTGKVYPGKIIRKVIEWNKPILSDEELASEVKEYLRKEGFYNESFISIPLTRNSEVVGVLNISNKKGGDRFSRKDLEVIQPLIQRLSLILGEGLKFRENLNSFGEMALTTMFDAFEIRYPYYMHHSDEVTDLSLRITRELGVNGEKERTVRLAAKLHDVGMVCIPSDIMNKEKKLTEGELQIVKKHPYVGWKLLENYPEFEDVRNYVLHHHERYDGSGYPFGLKGKDIPKEASIISVAEFFTSITSPRPYRTAVSRGDAIDIVTRQRGKWFEPEVVDALLRIVSP